VVFVNVLLIVDVVDAVVVSPVVFKLLEANQEYVEDTLLVNEILSVVPVQTVAVETEVITGVGLTITVYTDAVLQPLALVAVTVYKVFALGVAVTF